MDLRFGIRTNFVDEVTSIRELYEADIASQVGKALPNLEDQTGLNLLEVIYPIIEHRSMADGLPICIILQIVQGLIEQYISDCGRPCSQKWILDGNGQVITYLINGSCDKGIEADPQKLAPPVEDFFDGITEDLTNEKIKKGSSYLLNLNEVMVENSGANADIQKGQLLIALIDQISHLTKQKLQDIQRCHPSIGGSQDWYIDEDGSIIMELFLGEKQTDIQ